MLCFRQRIYHGLAAFLLIVVAILWWVAFPPGEAIADDRALWCPDASSACTYYDTIQEAVDAARADHQPGTIRVEDGTFDESVSVDKLKDVRIEADTAGETTITGSLAIDRSTDISIYDLVVTAGISISRAKGAFRIGSNTAELDITNSRFKNKTGTGLSVSGHEGNITLSDVSASNCSDRGADLYNYIAGGSVTLTNSRFDKNHGSGFTVSTKESITVTNVSARQNRGDGARLSSIWGSGSVLINVSGSGKNTFDKNRGTGLRIESAGTIALTGISACKNHGSGADLRNTEGSDDLFIDPGLPQGNKFDNNGGAGLFATSRGGIFLEDVSASGNETNGVDLSNIGGSGSIAVDTWACKLNKFDKNGHNGLLIFAAGSINLTDISSDKNQNWGALLNNQTGTGDVTIDTSRSSLNSFNKNGQDGIWINSSGIVSMSDIDSSRNEGFGIRLDNTDGNGGVTLQTLTAAINKLDKNGQKGLEIQSKGAIAIVDLQATKNTGGGMLLDNKSGSGDVTIGTSASKLNRFDHNGQFGLWVKANGAIDMIDVSASKNAEFGAYLTAGSNEVSVATVHSNLNRFDHNGDYGVWARTTGSIALMDVSASRNTGTGAILSTLGGTEGVTVSALADGGNLFNNNDDSGLFIESGGVINLENVNACCNGRVYNAAGLHMFTSEDAALTCSTFNRNNEYGIRAGLVSGQLYLNSVTAVDNTFMDIGFGGVPIIDDTVTCP